MLVSSLAASEDTTFSYELQGARAGNAEGTDGGFYTMAGRFHITLIDSSESEDIWLLDLAAKTADPLNPGQYSIGMFGQISAGLEIRAADHLAEFDATGGTLIIHSSDEGFIKGEFDLQAVDMDNGGNVIIKGAFNAGMADTKNQ